MCSRLTVSCAVREVTERQRAEESARFAVEIIGEDSHSKYVDLKQASADRCPRELGARVKAGEIMFHHEVTNQFLWNQF